MKPNAAGWKYGGTGTDRTELTGFNTNECRQEKVPRRATEFMRGLEKLSNKRSLVGERLRGAKGRKRTECAK